MVSMERPMDENLLGIGRFAHECGLSHKALRLYADLGLLVPAHTDRFTGYRYYDRAQLRVATRIRLMREMEMPLRDIRRVLSAEPDEAERLIAAHTRAMAQRLEQVRRTGRRLYETMRTEDFVMKLQVEQRELAPQQVVSLTGHVLVKDLDAFIIDSLDQLKAFVASQGGQISGPPLGIYHGPINHEDDGPIEVCLPAEGSFRASGSVAIRQLPGGQAAVVVAANEYTYFPKILEAYDAGCDWIVAGGRHPVGSPREVWIGTPESDGPFEITWIYE